MTVQIDCRDALASMEPLFFKAENDYDPANLPILNETLQWSRFFSKRKIRLAI